MTKPNVYGKDPKELAIVVELSKTIRHACLTRGAYVLDSTRALSLLAQDLLSIDFD